MMEDFNSETDSDYTSYWRDWVSFLHLLELEAVEYKGKGRSRAG
jgi:casein kinase II subunit beta